MSEFAVRYEDQEEEVVRFRVDNDQKAEWCLQKIREAQNDKAAWKRFYEAQYQRVEEAADATISQMSLMLQEYFDAVPHKINKASEVYQLPSGKLVSKKQEPEYSRTESEVINWLKANDMDEFVKIKESLDWAGLKEKVTVVGENVVTEDGEVVPGVKVTPREDIFKVEVK